MPTVELLGQRYDITPPKRRIYIPEVATELSARPLRAFAAALGLGCRGLWAVRTEPKYDGRASVYGDEVYELLAADGASADEIVTAGLEVWGVWKNLVPTTESVNEAKDFTPAGAGG